jgi:hypothetical protein
MSATIGFTTVLNVFGEKRNSEMLSTYVPGALVMRAPALPYLAPLPAADENRFTIAVRMSIKALNFAAGLFSESADNDLRLLPRATD